MTRWLALAGSGLILGLMPGCSFLFASGPPAGHEHLRYFDCTSDMGAQAGDASWAVVDGLLVAGLLSADKTTDSSGSSSTRSTGGAAAVFAVAAATHVASFIYGLVTTGHCSDAKQHMAQRMADRERDTDHTIATLRKQLEEQQAGKAPAAPNAPASAPATLELVPAPVPETVPPPPPAYTEPAPATPTTTKP